MEVLNSIEDNSLLIIPQVLRNKVLKYFNDNQIFKNIKIMTFNELKKGLLFDYTNQTINYVIKKLNVSYAIAVEYINSLYYIDDATKNEKMEFLKNLKDELDKENLLEYDSLFNNLIISKKTVYVFGFNNISKFNNYLLNKVNELINVVYLKRDDGNYEHEVLKFNSLEIEIKYVVEKIADLIYQGVDLNKIFIVNYDREYDFTINTIFKQYNIPIFLPSVDNLYSTTIAKYFINHLNKNIDVLLYELRKIFKANVIEENELIIKKINNLINTYYWCDNLENVKYLIIEEMKKIKIKNSHMLNEIKTTDLLNNVFCNDEYVFLIGFNDAKIPKFKKDEDYLDDANKPNFLGTSIEENKNIKDATLKAIKAIKNLTITYPLSSNFNSYLPSYLLRDESLTFKPMDNFISEYSNKSNKLYLAEALDNYLKYNVVDPNLEKLKSLNIDYKTYDNQFSGVDNEKLKKYLDGNITLSYSNLNDFYKCPYKFYLSNVLKINEYEELFEAFVGSLFHHCLQICLDTDIDVEETYNNYIEDNYKEPTNKETFFLEILKTEIVTIVKLIKEQYKHSKHNSVLAEKRIEFDIDKEIRFKIKGFVDKLLVFNNDVVIIDYKTNDTKMDPKKFEFGSTIQLPMYLYLLKVVEPDKNICGLYLQHILSKSKEYDEKKSREEIISNNLKLAGLTLNDGIKNFDDTCEKSTIISGLREKNGELVGRSVLSENEVSEIVALMEKLLNDAMDKIILGDFKINPIMLDNESGCTNCLYKDICYRRPSDFNYQSTGKEGDEDE